MSITSLLMLFENSEELINRDRVVRLENKLKELGWTNKKFNEAYDFVKANMPKPKKEGFSTSQFGGSITKDTPKQPKFIELYGDYLEGKIKELEEKMVKKPGIVDLSDGEKEEPEFYVPGVSDGLPPENVNMVQYKDDNKSKPLSSADPGKHGERVVKALEILASSLGKYGKDRALAIAYRQGIDPELIAAAGLGSIPYDCTDEDIWDLFDEQTKVHISRNKETGTVDKNLPFYDHVWQPFYIESLKYLRGDQKFEDETDDYLHGEDDYLPDETKQKIIDILTSESKVKLIKDLMVESSSGMCVINAGSKIIIENVRILSAEETGVVVNSPGRHYQVGVLYDDGALKDAMAAAIRIAKNHGYNKSPKFGMPERREDGLVTYFTFSK